MKLFRSTIIIAMLLISGAGNADFKQKAHEKVVAGIEKVSDDVHNTLILAKELGFFVNEIRFELSLTPKVEVFFRDAGDTGRFDEVLGKAKKAQKAALRLLQATRKFNVAHYSPTGVKLITGLAKPSVEILSSWQE